MEVFFKDGCFSSDKCTLMSIREAETKTNIFSDKLPPISENSFLNGIQYSNFNERQSNFTILKIRQSCISVHMNKISGRAYSVYSLRHAGKFAPIKVSSLISMKLKGSVKLPWEVRGRCRSCSWRKVNLSWFMNSYMVKTEEYDNVDLVFGFKIF